MAKAAIFRQKFLSHQIRSVEKPQFTMMWSISFQAIFDPKIGLKRPKNSKRRHFWAKFFALFDSKRRKTPISLLYGVFRFGPFLTKKGQKMA